MKLRITDAAIAAGYESQQCASSPVVRIILEAALPHIEVDASEPIAPAKVKALEWEDAKDRGYSQADSALGQYQVSWLGEFECWQCYRPHKPGSTWDKNFSQHPIKDEAKAAAQDDYDTRILSALNSSPGKVADAMQFFSENVDRWGAAEWFDRLAKAIREQDKAVVAKDDISFDTYRMIAASSAMTLVRDHEATVRASLALASTALVEALRKTLLDVEEIIFANTLRLGSAEYSRARKLIRDALATAPGINAGGLSDTSGIPPLPWHVDRSGGFAGIYDANRESVISYTNADDGLHAAPGVLEAIAATMNAVWPR